MHTLLLIDDDRMLCHMFREYLNGNEFIVFETNTGYRSLDILKQHKVDAVLLDIGLPDGNGLDFISKIKHYSSLPIVVMSSEKDPAIHVNAFEAGADDFVQKPFHLKEMEARILSHIRRWQSSPSNTNMAGQKAPALEKICFGNWTLDLQKYQLFDHNKQASNLTACEFNLLKTLIENKGCVLRREDLCEAVKADNYTPTPRAIDIKIARIRKKLGDDAANPLLIKTIRGVGYLINTDTTS